MSLLLGLGVWYLLKQILAVLELVFFFQVTGVGCYSHVFPLPMVLTSPSYK